MKLIPAVLSDYKGYTVAALEKCSLNVDKKIRYLADVSLQHILGSLGNTSLTQLN